MIKIKQKLPTVLMIVAGVALLAIISFALAQLLGFNIPSDPVVQTPTAGSPTEPDVDPTEPSFTLETIRTAKLSDVSAKDAAYDTVCYMLYYDVMDAEKGMFYPQRVATQVEALDALKRLTGLDFSDPKKPAAPLTRGELAAILFDAAEKCGRSTKYTIKELGYTDSSKITKANRNAILWTTEKKLFRSFVGNEMLETMAVSRLQLAQALIAFQSYDPDDILAPEIFEKTSSRTDGTKSLNKHAQIQERIDAIAKEYGAMGLQVAVIEKGVVTDTYVYGWATKDTDPMTAEHKQRIASISKVVLGITAQLLREDGVLDLDGDISKYWGGAVRNPQYPDEPITFRKILSHTSSIRGDGTSYTYSNVKEYLMGDNFSDFRPGDINGWMYNNYAYAILGMTMELAADQCTNDILREKLFNVMGIDAAFAPGDIKNTNKLMTLYRDDHTIGRTVAAQKTHHSPKTPGGSGGFFAGGFTSSAKDMAKLIALLANDGLYEGVRFMDAQSVEIMETLFSDIEVYKDSYQALPMRQYKKMYNRDAVYCHTGSAYGVYNCISYDAKTGDGVVVLTSGAGKQTDARGIYKVCSDINAYIYNVID